MGSSLRMFFDRFVPAGIKEAGDITTILRARVLAGMYFSNVIIALLVLLIFSFATLFTDVEITPGLIAVGIALIFLAFQIYLFYRIHNVAISGIVFSMTFFGLTLAAVIITGGWHSPILFLLFCSPAVSFLVGGGAEGKYMAGLIFTCGVALFAANAVDFQVFKILKDENVELVKTVIWIISLTTFVSCLAVYDSLLNSILSHLERQDIS